MAGPQFFQTGMGQKFFEGTLPRLVQAAEDIHQELKRANDLKEKDHESAINKKVEEKEV